MIIRYVLFAVVSMAVNLLAYMLSPFLAAYSVWKDIDVLPYPWSLFHTHDNTLDGGQKQGYRIGVRGLSLWWQRVCWICRNPGYGFDAYILGFAHAGYRVLSEKGDQASFGVDNRGFYSNVMQAANGKKYFSYRRNVPLWGRRYIKVWFGWNYMAYGGERHQIKVHLGSLKTAD